MLWLHAECHNLWCTACRTGAGNTGGWKEVKSTGCSVCLCSEWLSSLKSVYLFIVVECTDRLRCDRSLLTRSCMSAYIAYPLPYLLELCFDFVPYQLPLEVDFLLHTSSNRLIATAVGLMLFWIARAKQHDRFYSFICLIKYILNFKFLTWNVKTCFLVEVC